MSSPKRFREPDLAGVPTVLDDDADKKFKQEIQASNPEGPERP
jgi:hypothetical protein